MKTSQRSARRPLDEGDELAPSGPCEAERPDELSPFAELPPLHLSIVNVPFRSECEGFDGGCLEAFFRDREIESAREYFYVHEGRPHLSCWIEWRKREPLAAEGRERATGARRNAAQPDIVLTPEEESRFEALRAWRLASARESAVPAYRILSDRCLRHIVRARPASLEQLAATPGIPRPSVERYGQALLDVLSNTPANEPASSARALDGGGPTSSEAATATTQRQPPEPAPVSIADGGTHLPLELAR